MNRDFSSISPSASALLLTKSLTEIPFIRQAANLVWGSDETKNIAAKLADEQFVKRLTHFERRYRSVDELLQKENNLNIIEISSGFSFRGLSITLQYPDIVFIDTDLSDLIDTKKRITTQLLHEIKTDLPINLHTEPLNVLDEAAFNDLVSRFNPGPITIINEGLLVYLNRKEKITLSGIIHRILKQRGGCWITADIYVKANHLFPNVSADPSGEYKVASDFLKRHNVEENKFENIDDARHFFEDQGFHVRQKAGLANASRIRETWALVLR